MPVEGIHSPIIYPNWRNVFSFKRFRFKKDTTFFLWLAYIYSPLHLLRFILFGVRTITVAFWSACKIMSFIFSKLTNLEALKLSVIPRTLHTVLIATVDVFRVLYAYFSGQHRQTRKLFHRVSVPMSSAPNCPPFRWAWVRFSVVCI
jgi:hypothetical protein